MTTTEPSPRDPSGPEAGLHGAARAEAAASSLCFRDPAGARLELISDPLGKAFGSTVL